MSEFVIPLSLDGLLEASSSTQYSVSNVSSVREIPGKLQECRLYYKKEGPFFILDQNNFDALYSILVHFKNLDEQSQFNTWDLMIKVMSDMASKLDKVLCDTETTYNERQKWVPCTKMNSYIACMLTEAFENNFNKPTTEIIMPGKKGKRSAKKSEFGGDWEMERKRMLVQFYSLLELPLGRLWDPPVMEEDYVNLLANCCYKILETPSVSHVRLKDIRESIFQILGILVLKFNHGLACSLKLMQLLQHFEHLVSPAAQGVALMVHKYGSKSVLQDMIREVGKMDGRDARDSSGLRNYSLFFIEIAEACPDLFISSLSLMIPFLGQEPYGMRTCVLSIMGSIVLKVLRGENLNAKNRSLRNDYLYYLENFIHDSNAFVRSKVLQIWQDLIEGHAVPLAQQKPILAKVVGRLRDKSSNVRKYALHLLTAFLKANPFAAKLPLEDLKDQFEVEMKKLKELDPEANLEEEQKNKTDNPDDPAIDEWVERVPSVIKALKELIPIDTSDAESDSDEESEDEEEKLLPEESELNDGVLAVGEALKVLEMEKAIKILKEVKIKFADAEVLQTNTFEEMVYESLPNCAVLANDQLTYLSLLERIFIPFIKMQQQATRMEEEASQKMDDSDAIERKRKDEEVQKQRILCCYLRDSVSFAREIHSGMSDICQLLSSRQQSDVMESINFFVTAFEFGVLNAMSGVRRMLVLVWSKEPTIKDAVVSAYKRLYLNEDAGSERARALHIVRNLTALSTGATMGELASLEEIISQFVKSGDMDKNCFTLLWERFTKALPETSDDDARGALLLLSMASGSSVSIISSNLPLLISIGLGERGENDFSLVKIVCSAVCKMVPSKIKTDDPNPPFRLPQDHDLFVRLSEILANGASKLCDKQYSPMAVEAITAIYLLAEHPDIICGDILKKLLQLLMDKHNEWEKDNRENNTQDPLQPGIHVPMPLLSRFLVVAGHIASRHLVHLDTYIFSELKRRSNLREEQEQKLKKKKSNKKKRKSLATSAHEASTIKSSQEGDMEEEMGLTGAVADDMEVEFIRDICENKTVTGETLLDLIRPLIIAICANPTKYSDSDLRTAASLALAKFMLVSSVCCEENLQLLFTILEKSTEPIIRANTIISIGDLTFRFPNLVEPWTPRIYARLHDESTVVRRNTLTILTHLILNDQVKVKGQISDIALCTTDDDERLAGLSRLFFNELSKKGNSLYNVLPDIISRLSDKHNAVEEETFKTIISYIFGLIQKDRQLETFIEKLCHRLQATDSPRQWRDITFCLSLLPYTEKGIRKLQENIGCYSDKLYEATVYEYFLGMMAAARKLSKNESKGAIEELEARLEEHHNKGVEDENAVNKAAGAKKKQAGPKISQRQKVDSSDSDSEDDSEAKTHPAHRNAKENIPPNQKRRVSTRLAKPIHQSSSSSSESEAEEQDTTRSSVGEGGGGNAETDDDVFEKPGRQKRSIPPQPPVSLKKKSEVRVSKKILGTSIKTEKETPSRRSSRR